MNEWMESGRWVEVIIVLMVLEGLGLAAYRRVTGKGIAIVDLAANFAAGAFLLMALRSALVQDGWKSIALWLTGALVAHAVDLSRRWRGN